MGLMFTVGGIFGSGEAAVVSGECIRDRASAFVFLDTGQYVIVN